MNVLVTGGAGYLGSIVTEELAREGHKLVILDNLQQGHRDAVSPGVKFIPADICDRKALDAAFRRSRIEAVIHLAAETVVAYSMTDPKRYFQTNVLGGINLLDVMLKHDVRKLIFSSSAAVYGDPHSIPIEEEHPKNPINAYGESKLIFERIMEWYGKAYGLKSISFRYFNAAGASEKFGESHDPETHLIPNVLKAALEDRPVTVFGTDYPTKDGSCMRDYVHVIDIARAHLLALERLESLGNRGYNLGNAKGYSVLEVIEAARRVTGAAIPIKVQSRRPGDPVTLVASFNRAESELGWEPRFSRLEDIIESAWRWLKQQPDGYAQ